MNQILPPDISCPVGTTLKNKTYRIGHLLGRGGFGAVYLANDLVKQRQCAIKESFDNSQGAQIQFTMEATILMLLNHAILPQVTDHFIEPSGQQYLVMEYVEGQDLGGLLQHSGPLSEDKVRMWIDQVLDAVAYLHDYQPRPVIHRDIKPNNIRLLPDGETVKLVDFGIAKIGGAGEKTRQAARAASDGFSPPEQYGTGTDTYSDVYALGATLYNLLTNVVPPNAIDRAHSGAQLVAPRQLNPRISQDMQQIILTAMQIDPKRRFSNAGEMRRALLGERLSTSSTSCPHCGAATQVSSKFCAKCGQPIVASYRLSPTQPQTSVSTSADLITFCDKSWEWGGHFLRNGRIEAFLRFMGEDDYAQIAANSRQAPNLNAALEGLLRAMGAAPPTEYQTNIDHVLSQLGFGLLPRLGRKPSVVTLVIQNSSPRGYLHGYLTPLASWLTVPEPHFGCLPNQIAEIELHANHKARKWSLFSLNTELFEIVVIN